MIKSLRWRLQAWHAVVLTVVLATFGGVVSMLLWQSHLQQVDEELDRLSAAVMSQMRRLLPPPPVPFRRSRGSGNEPNEQRRDGRPNESATAQPGTPAPLTGTSPAVAGNVPNNESRPNVAPTDQALARISEGSQDAARPVPPNSNREHSSDRDRERYGSAASMKLPAEFVALFEGSDDSRPYFAIWSREGFLLQKSAGSPDVPFPGLRRVDSELPLRQVRTRDGLREVVHVTFWDINLLVGRSLKKDSAAQRAATLWLFVVGAGVLSCGLLGGYWTSTRAIRPLAEMSRTAASISARNLSERIDLEDTDNELGQLALVLNQTFDRLESAFEQQTRFTADASHELRTPLAVMLAQTELALSKSRNASEYREALESCRRAAQRMKSLVESLLILARFDAGEPGLKLQSLDLEAFVRDGVDLIRPLANERHITVECWTSPVTVQADRERLGQVLTNLLTNAIRYNRDGGRIDVTIEVDEGQAILGVTDTGIGIAGEDLMHIFERFHRADKARSRADGGSGLGLAICKSIVEAHGGTIAVRSEPQVGTTFEVRLPRRAESGPISSYALPAVNFENNSSAVTEPSAPEVGANASHPVSI